MNKKTKIILLSIILSIFTILIGIIIVIHKKPKETEKENLEHNYAVNDTADITSEEITTEELSNEVMMIEDVEFSHLEKLTSEQTADRLSMISDLNTRTKYDTETHGKVTSNEVLDSSTEFQVYIKTTFEDGETQIYVCNYDATNLHSFLRCVTLEEWNYYHSGENAG